MNNQKQPSPPPKTQFAHIEIFYLFVFLLLQFSKIFNLEKNKLKLNLMTKLI